MDLIQMMLDCAETMTAVLDNITYMGINVNTLKFFACVCTFVALLIALVVGSHGSLSMLFVMKVMVSLLEILSYATTLLATGMQLPVACNYLCNCNGVLQLFWVCMQLCYNYDRLHPNLWMIYVNIYYRIYTFGCILSYIFDMHVLIVACATKIGLLWSFGKLGTHFL